MNRSIALFVALAVFVAHAFAVHSNLSGDLAAPGDTAYAAFRVARNLVHEGSWSWQYGEPGIDAYPSALWVWVYAVAERLLWPSKTFVAAVGLGAGLLTMIVASRFHRDRIASLIAPLLLAISGGFAAAAVSGTEWSLFTLFLLTAFAALEKDHHRWLAAALALAGWTRPEGWLMGGVLFVMQLVRRKREGRGALWPFAVAAAAAGVLAWLRYSQTGHLLSPALRDLWDGDAARWSDGLADFVSFQFLYAAPLLVGFALWYLLRGRLTNTGRRALELYVAWSLIAVAAGGGRQGFHQLFLPGLPLALIAAQEGMICALNSPRQVVRGVAWTTFVLAVLGAGVASRTGGDLGPLPLERWQRVLDRRTASAPRFGYANHLGRDGLNEALEVDALLRAVGIYVRDHLDSHASVGSFWPGSIAYLSRRDVWDLGGRATPVADGESLRSWSAPISVDLALALQRKPDYLVPRARSARTVPTADELAEEWLRGVDRAPSDAAHIAGVRAALEEYELITVPVRPQLGRTAGNVDRPVHLLRRRALDLAPRLSVEVEGGALRVLLQHDGPEQLADLRVLLEDDEGRTYAMNPRGEAVASPQVLARPRLLIRPTSEGRDVLAFHADLGDEVQRLRRVRAVLRNPFAAGEDAFDYASAEVIVELR